MPTARDRALTDATRCDAATETANTKVRGTLPCSRHLVARPAAQVPESASLQQHMTALRGFARRSWAFITSNAPAEPHALTKAGRGHYESFSRYLGTCSRARFTDLFKRREEAQAQSFAWGIAPNRTGDSPGPSKWLEDARSGPMLALWHMLPWVLSRAEGTLDSVEPSS